ncbi:MAG: acyltransferase [Ruminococcaceae bacterium]|nr:acyltransferase [Oscillospiraceae bacterium]
MYYFINYLRALATILITNSHYGQIWPIDDLAAGGLLGNILFFAASGFCLFSIKEKFGKWYLKRIVRIYPVMLVFTLLTVLFGQYSLTTGQDALRLFLYPTNYIFLVWLMISYVAFYIVAWFSKKYAHFTEYTLGVVLIAWIVAYFAIVDKSVYHIDDVSKPFILFLYFSSMLIGALFKKHVDSFKKTKAINVAFLFVSLIIYFGSKIAFSKIQTIVFWQILNQLSILAVLYFMFAVFAGLEDKLKKAPKWLNKPIEFMANITLHLYLVQFVIIRAFEKYVFPINFVITTVTIIAAASVLYFAEHYIRKGVLLLADKIKRKKKYAEGND